MSVVYGDSEGGTRAFKATHRADNARRLRAAKRHSRHVRMLRIAIPLAVVIGGVALALVTWFNPLRMLSRLPISLGDVVISGTKIKMENPRLSGFTRDSRRYDLTAGTAAQDLARPGIVELQDLSATVEMEDKTLVKMSAASGTFDTKAEVLTLDRNIVVTSSSGYEGYLEEAVVDTRSGNMVSEKPVTMKMLNGTVKSSRFEVLQAGDLILFNKGVVVNMTVNPTPTSDGQRGETP